jgi:hypothetical protein
MDERQAEVLMIDLSRASAPTEGGFCTYQPVVSGDACPWNLDCHSCDKFVLSGADLLYWRRKREQWASIAERDTQHEHYSEAFGRLSAENATLRQRIRDIAAGQRTLEERLQAARSNNRFLDKRIAGLEAQLLAAEPRT